MELLITLLGFLAMGAFCTLFERLWPENARQPGWRKDSWIDVLYLSLRISLSVMLMLMTVLIGRSLTSPTASRMSWQPVWVQVLEILFLSDLISYWVHRTLHVFTPLWRLHAIHHSAEQIDWLVASRNHPLEPLLIKVLMNYPLYLIGFSPALLASVMPAAAAYSLLLHANVSWGYGPLGYIIASPAFHRWHHSSEAPAIDKNFAQLFSLCDYLFGTAYFPRGVHSEKYGLNNETLPLGVWSHFTYPFRDLPARWRQWVNRPSPRPQGRIHEATEPRKAGAFDQ